MALLNSNPAWSDEEKLKFIEEVTADADAVQERLLADILRRHAETEYLQRHKLDGATDRAAFKAKVPVIKYEDIQSDIDRIANGDRSPILTADPVSEFFTSSGTSAGRRKLIPITENEFGRRLSFFSLIPAVRNQGVPGLTTGKRLHIMTLRPESKTPGGLVARAASVGYVKALSDQIQKGNTSPWAAILCEDYFQSLYVQMLCSLYQRTEIVQIESSFASSLVTSVHFLRDHWPQLARDIRSGTLADQITEPSLRESLSDVLKPDPDLANLIAEQCSSPDWSAIIAKIWQNVKCLGTIITGSMLQYRAVLECYAGGIPIVSTLYASSESNFGINLLPICDPAKVSYTMLPNLAYFEFIPHEPEMENGRCEPVDLVKVELGKRYRLVITTYAGLYRYQVGDVLEVTGFHNASPQFRVVCRDGVLLSIETDKTDEVDLQGAVDRASAILDVHGTTLAGYTSYADAKSSPGHYVMFWELLLSDGVQKPCDQVMERCCLAMEEALNQVYRERRVAGVIGPLEIRVVAGGAFVKLMELAVARGASIDQYKVPRCVKNEEMIELLDSQTLSAHFSPVCPNASMSSGSPIWQAILILVFKIILN